MSKDKSIFISIASYRDPELEPTIKSIIDNAKYKDRLNIKIIRQFTEEDNGSDDPVAYRDNPLVEIIDTPHNQSNGVCKIRSDLQKMYNGEDYILQLDSHHRFIKNWDVEIIKDLELLKKVNKDDKPILTAYLPSYEPGKPKESINLPWEMRFDRFLPQGPAMPKPETIDDHKELSKPVRAYMLSGHFIFADGKYYEDVLYDPGFYFHGEEISLAIRAYTHGYNLYHPHRLLAWHQYTRAGSKRHWDDSKQWDDLNSKSFARYRKLVKIDKCKKGELGKYGLGTERTLNQYIRYSGIDVTNKMIHKENLARQRAPMKYKKGEYKPGFCKKIRYCIDLYKGAVPLDDYDVWVTAFIDANGEEIHRKDYPAGEIKMLKKSVENDDNFYKIWTEFEAPTEPVEWLVWPHSESKDWCDRIVNKIQVA